MMTSDKLKVLIRVMNNSKVMVRDFSDTEFKIFPTLEKATTYIKELYIKKEALDAEENKRVAKNE